MTTPEPAGDPVLVELRAIREAISARQKIAPLPALIPQEDVPGYVGISRPVMFRLIAAGKFPKAVEAGGGKKFRRSDLDKWVASLKPARQQAAGAYRRGAGEAARHRRRQSPPAPRADRAESRRPVRRRRHVGVPGGGAGRPLRPALPPGQRPALGPPPRRVHEEREERDPAPRPRRGAAARPLLRARPSGPLFPGSWHDKAVVMFAMDLADAGIVTATAEGKAVFHSLRHTFATMIGRAAPLKVAMDRARHSTPDLTVGRYSHAELAEKAAAVASIPLTGESEAGLTRAQLEAIGVVALAVFHLLLVTPLITPGVDSAGDSARPPETIRGRGKGRGK